MRGIEAKMITADDVSMGPPTSLPTTIQRIREIVVDNGPRTACHYKGVTYVGLNGGKVCKIDYQQAASASEFAKLDNSIVGIIAHLDRLYILKLDTPHVVFLFDLHGKQLHKWDLENHTNYTANAMAVVGDQLLLADNSNACIAVYTLNGEKRRSIPCPLMGSGFNSVCGCGPDAVVIADDDSNKIFRVKLSTGEVEWTSDAVNKPIGVCQYSDKYILVTTAANIHQAKVWILNSKSGEQTKGLGIYLTKDGHSL